MKDDQSWDGSSLLEETRIAQGHALELVLGAVVASILLGLSINLTASWLFQTYSRQLVLLIMIISGAIGLILIIVFAFHILTTLKEFHQDIEIPLPLLVSKQDIEVIHVRNYDNVTEPLHAALAHRPAQERQNIAQILQSTHATNVAARPEVVLFVLELIQFLLATQMVQDSERLLGSKASFRKSREVMQLQSSTVTSQWHDLASQVPNNQYLQNTLQGVPQKFLLPHGIKLQLSDTAQELSGRTRSSRPNIPGPKEVTLLKATVGRNTALRVSAITPFSMYGLPKPNEPRRGLTARCILRNAQNQRLHDLACEEERAAAQLNYDGKALQPASQGQPDPVAYYTTLYKKLYTGGQQPYLMRIFIRIDGSFRIHQFRFWINEKRKYRLYAWGKELSRLLSHMDIEEFMGTLKDDGQKTPHRVF